MRVILNGTEDLIGQAKAAQFALSLGKPDSNPPFRYITRGKDEYAVMFNKKSVSVWPQKDKYDVQV